MAPNQNQNIKLSKSDHHIEKKAKDDKLQDVCWQKRKMLVAIAIVLVIMISVCATLIVTYIMKEEKKDPNFSNDLTTLTTSFHSSTHSTKTEEILRSTSTTAAQIPSSDVSSTSTTDSITIDPFVIVTRSEWNALPMKGQQKLKLPVERIFIKDTQTEPCIEKEACLNFVKKRQRDSWNSRYMSFPLHDIQENFLISEDGRIFEGRGFAYEGQHTYDHSSTSYNSKAICVSFIGTYSNVSLTSKQVEAYNWLIQMQKECGNISVDFKLFFSDQVASLRDVSVYSDNLYQTIRSWDNWIERKY